MSGALHSDDHVLSVGERIVGGVQQRDVVVAVVLTAPAPVHVDLAVGTVAVNDEGMATHPGVGTAVVERTVLAKLAIDIVHPSRLGVLVAL